MRWSIFGEGMLSAGLAGVLGRLALLAVAAGAIVFKTMESQFADVI